MPVIDNKLEIQTVDEALEAIEALGLFMTRYQRNHCKREAFIDICGDLNSAKWKIAKYCYDDEKC